MLIASNQTVEINLICVYLAAWAWKVNLTTVKSHALINLSVILVLK